MPARTRPPKSQLDPPACSRRKPADGVQSGHVDASTATNGRKEDLMKKAIFSAMAVTFLGAAAAQAAPLPVRGTISSVNGTTLQITETSGQEISVKLAPNAQISEVVPGSLADVKAGSYVGTAAVKQPSGLYRAMELQIFPASMRGTGLGTRSWNLAPHSTMTNGTVGGLTQTGGAVSAVSGSGNLTLSVNDGTGMKTVLIPDGVPVVTYKPGQSADLVPGAHVLFFPATAGSGSMTTARINVGMNGLVPPM
jgi:hypothetical protein